MPNLSWRAPMETISHRPKIRHHLAAYPDVRDWSTPSAFAGRGHYAERLEARRSRRAPFVRLLSNDLRRSTLQVWRRVDTNQPAKQHGLAVERLLLPRSPGLYSGPPSAMLLR